MKIKILFMVLAFFAAAVGGSLYTIAAGNVSGWLWGGSGIDIPPVQETGMGWIDLRSGETNGVHIPNSDGSVTGYAWSSTYGWIDFAPQNNCGVAYSAASCAAPAGGIAGVARSGNNLINYARVVGIAQASTTGNNGGWDGWIQMDPASGGVSIDPSTGTLSGHAWSGEYDLIGLIKEGIGWIDFSLATVIPVKELKVCQNSCDSNTQISALSMSQGNSRNAVACYTSTTCNEAASNVTSHASTVWTEDLGASNVVSLRGTDPEQIHADQAATGTETIQVDYTDPVDGLQTVSINVAVTGTLCGNGVQEIGEACDDGVSSNGVCPAVCSASCVVNICSDDKWREVTP